MKVKVKAIHLAKVYYAVRAILGIDNRSIDYVNFEYGLDSVYIYNLDHYYCVRPNTYVDIDFTNVIDDRKVSDYCGIIEKTTKRRFMKVTVNAYELYKNYFTLGHTIKYGRRTVKYIAYDQLTKSVTIFCRDVNFTMDREKDIEISIKLVQDVVEEFSVLGAK